jgi:hypothetical protein
MWSDLLLDPFGKWTAACCNTLDLYVAAHHLTLSVHSFIYSQAEEEEFEQARREHLHQELLRIQRTNFYHFGLICLVPLVMLLLVVITSLNQDGSCEADFGTECFYENRGFMSAFARQCICKGIKVVAG